MEWTPGTVQVLEMNAFPAPPARVFDALTAPGLRLGG